MTEYLETLELTDKLEIGITQSDLWEDANPGSLDYGCPFNITYLKRSRYTLGNTPVESPTQHLLELVGTDYEQEYYYGTEEHIVEKLNDRFDRDYIWQPVYAVIHGGIALRTGSPIPNPYYGFDSGQSGIIYISKKEALNIWGKKRASRKFIEEIKRLQGDVIKGLCQYINGDVYEADVICKDCGERLEWLGTYWGFGDWKTNGLLDDAEYYKTHPLICLCEEDLDTPVSYLKNGEDK